ncbi:MAG TPA: energy-coupling factor ABC transporter substrate-binding protein [Anaerolineae bacterium]|nr:energy-coupling factor ABC transporter substrate-binding protein [Anaerolineae bacterium]
MTSRQTSQPKHTRIWTILGIIAILFLMAWPLLTIKDSDFGGSDGVGSEIIAQMAPDYDPTWISNVWTPPGSETESMLFGIQAAFGGILIGYFFGYSRGKRSSS